jgi:hypothetical protein
LRSIRVTIDAVEKQEELHILSAYFVALIIQLAMRMRRIILLSVACPDVPCLINVTIFGKKID